MDTTNILNRILSLNSQDRIRLLQGIIVFDVHISGEPGRLLQISLGLVSTTPGQVKSDILGSQQWELNHQMSLEDREELYHQIVNLDIQDRMLLEQGISNSITPEPVKSDLTELQQHEINRLKDLEDQKTPYGQVALTFATALVNGKFEDAHNLLSPSIKDEWSPELLKDTYEEMVEYFGDLPVNYISTGVVDTSLPEDSWVYVDIACDGCGEAVTVTIEPEDGKYLIQKIEWGRP
jgi:hypothetical protein